MIRTVLSINTNFIGTQLLYRIKSTHPFSLFVLFCSSFFSISIFFFCHPWNIKQIDKFEVDQANIEVYRISIEFERILIECNRIYIFSTSIVLRLAELIEVNQLINSFNSICFDWLPPNQSINSKGKVTSRMFRYVGITNIS